MLIDTVHLALNSLSHVGALTHAHTHTRTQPRRVNTNREKMDDMVSTASQDGQDVLELKINYTGRVLVR